MRVDFLVDNPKSYTYENFLCHQLLKVAKIDLRRVVIEEGELGEYLQRPKCDFILSAEPLLDQHPPLCDLLEVPQFVMPEHSIGPAATFLKATFSHVAYREPLEEVFFLPPAIDGGLKGCQQRRFPVVHFGDLRTPERQGLIYETLFTKEGKKQLESAAQQSLHPYAAARSVIDSNLSLNDLVLGIEEMRRAQATRHLVETLRAFPLHLFGSYVGRDLLLKVPPQTYLHAPLPYSEHIELLKQTHILICPCVSHTDGWEPWLLPALQVGALPLLEPTAYMRQMLPDERLFYTSDEELKEKVAYYLTHENERQACVAQLAAQLAPHYTWEKRMEALTQEMERRLDASDFVRTNSTRVNDETD